MLCPIKFPLSTEIVLIEFVLRAWPLKTSKWGIIAFLNGTVTFIPFNSPCLKLLHSSDNSFSLTANLP